MNQVYFYPMPRSSNAILPAYRLNPFMNQVYFYFLLLTNKDKPLKCLNPFMNQVYFYAALPKPRRARVCGPVCANSGRMAAKKWKQGCLSSCNLWKCQRKTACATFAAGILRKCIFSVRYKNGPQRGARSRMDYSPRRLRMRATFSFCFLESCFPCHLPDACQKAFSASAACRCRGASSASSCWKSVCAV